MFRHHRILYRRLLRGQSSDELLALRLESALFPTLLCLIEDELQRRADSVESAGAAMSVREITRLRPFIAPTRTAAQS